MIAKEEYSIRLKMAEMHEEFIERMSEAYDNQYYVEAVWYCYAIFEQRISRLIAKYIDQCNRPDRKDDKSAAISTRISCLQTVIQKNYGVYGSIDVALLDRILKWCKNRNELVHGLISLKHYKKYDEEFKKLAEIGVPLVFELYDVCSDFRNRWYKSDEPSVPLPVEKCRCKQKCINAANL